MVSFAAGGVFGGLSGVSSVIRHGSIQYSNRIANTVAQQMRDSSRYLSQTQKTSMSLVHQVQNSYSSGLSSVGRSQGKNLFRLNLGVEAVGAGLSIASGWK